MEEDIQGDETFRDSLSTIDQQGKRVWVYPKKPSGRFHNWRVLVSASLLLFLFAAPWIRVSGHPLLMFNVLERKFSIFGVVFWPQDFYLFVLAMLSFIVFIVLFTVVYGRIFCGWICPQTIFMEMVFRKIEYWIEGDWTHQKKLKKQPWNGEKLRKRVSKHLIFLVISFIIANTFLAYIIGSDELSKIITDPLSQHLGGFASLMIFSLAFYFVFTQLREQVCTTICPYGRLQGVLLDKDSIVVAYDYKRGESRAKFRKNEIRKDVNKGDCIDCKQCVHVCPTGIDIRNGTQLECVNCTACIDACDHMMDSVGLDRGLIRYASENMIAKKEKMKFTTRVIAYSAILLILLITTTSLMLSRTELNAIILRAKADRPYIIGDDQTISNLYNFKIINKSDREMNLELKPIDDYVNLEIIGGDIIVASGEMREGALFIRLKESDIKSMKTTLKIQVLENGASQDILETTFLGPVK